jgi:hypothetical protein
LRFWGFAGAATVKGSDRDVPASERPLKADVKAS